jgi:hypothetical protein
LGHSTIFANKHYWQVTDVDISRATRPTEPADKKVAQQAHAETRGKPHAATPAHERTPVLQGYATSRDTVQNRGMGDEGLERVATNPLTNKDLRQSRFDGAAKSDAFLTNCSGDDESLRLVIERWPQLSNENRQRVLALVNKF